MSFAPAHRLSQMSPQLRGERVLYVDATDFAPDAVTLDTLARLTLESRRLGYRVRLRGVSPELAGLIDLAGLSDALPLDPLNRLSSDSTPPRC
jgi:anti-anti-sigma regulatory factor